MVCPCAADSYRREHHWKIDEVEDHDADKQTFRPAKKFPATYAESELDDEIPSGIAGEAESKAWSPMEREKCDVRIVLNEIEDHV